MASLANVQQKVADLAALRAVDAPPSAIWLESLDLTKMTCGWQDPMAGKSVGKNPIVLKGVTYPHGVGTHAMSQLLVDLKGAATRFECMAGVDDEKTGEGSVRFEVYVDSIRKARTRALHGGDPPVPISVDLTGAKRLRLVVTDAGDGIDSDHADWAGAMIYLNGIAKPVAIVAPPEPLPDIAHMDTSPKPAIHGPRVVGTTPGRPFIFLIPATGEAPRKFSAKNLPAGLKLDGSTGIITGSVGNAGSYAVDLTIKNSKGAAKRKLTIIAGDHKLAQTPPMGWNSWNVWAGAVDDEKVRAAADWMVKSGLAAHGFQYVNIDDCWEAGRDADGKILANEKFPDMKASTDYVHSKGLRFGIYSSPGPKTCAGFEATYQHELLDAQRYAEWGVDYLKYDWCSYGGIAPPKPTIDDFQKPYKVMREALDECSRDIVFSFCQYGMGNSWEWAGSIGGNCWRTTGDINDSWGSLSSIAFSQDGHEEFAGPGHWNDPDMLVVGHVGWGPSLHPSYLTPNEQLLHITFWCLLSSPLLLGCDLTKLDQFTLDMMTNDEVLDINQDPLGKPAGRKQRHGDLEVWSRPLFDGTTAVGLFNKGEEPAEVTARWSAIGVSGRQPVRDLWRHKDLGSFDGTFKVMVPRHGAVLVKVGKPK